MISYRIYDMKNKEKNMNDKTVTFAAFTDLHLDLMHDGEKRMEVFFREAEEADVDFIIQLGDLCYPRGILGVAPEAILPVNLLIAMEHPPIQPGKETVLERLRSFPKPAYFVLGNHDMDFCSKKEAMEVYNMSSPYYAFHLKGWHFLVLDGNHYRNDEGELKDFGYAASYYRDLPYLGKEQLDWLKNELTSSDEPAVLFCHQPMYRKVREFRDLTEFQEVISFVKKRGKKIRLCMNGHLHIDDLHIEEGTVFHSLNSISNFWAGEEYETLRYAEEIDRDYPSLRYTFPYKKPVFAIITLTDRELVIKGRHSGFVQPGARHFSVRPMPLSCVRSHHLVWPE